MIFGKHVILRSQVILAFFCVLLMCVTSSADDSNLGPITVSSFLPNYLPVSDDNIALEDIDVVSLVTRYAVTSGDDFDCNLNWTLNADLTFRADNGVVYSVHWYDHKNSYSKTLDECDADQSVTYYGEYAKKVAGANPGQYKSNEWVLRTEFSNEMAIIVGKINERIASTQNGLPLPAPDVSDNRVLARPVLFVHGAGDSAERWGVDYARRDCGDPKVSAASYSHMSWYPSSSGRVFPVLNFSLTAKCSDGMDMQKQKWMYVPDLPGRKLVFADNSTWLDRLPEVVSITHAWLNVISFAWAIPDGSNAIPEPTDIVANLNQELTNIINSSKSFTGKTVYSNGHWWKIAISNIFYDDLVRGRDVWEELDNVPQSLLGKSLPSAKVNSLVQSYGDGTAPDILARIEHLNRKYDWKTPEDGINNNGIYFYTAMDYSVPGAPPAPWNPNDFHGYLYADAVYPGTTGYFDNYSGKGQSYQLYLRMIEVLDKHYGKGNWEKDANAKIDLVAHSQGGLLVRDMLAHAKDPFLPDGQTAMPQGLNHPGAHIRKAVTLNSPHFGSAFAEDQSVLDSDPTGEFSSIGMLKDWMTNSRQLKTPTTLDISKIQVTGVDGAVAAGCGVGAVFGGGAGCAVGGLLGGAISAPILYGTDATWSVSGKALGPYNIHVFFDIPGPFNKTLNNELSFMDKNEVGRVVDGQKTNRHLAPSSDWIIGLKKTKYPLLPGTNTPVNILPLYTAGLPTLREDIATELYRNQSSYCSNHADGWVKECDITSWLFLGMAAGNINDGSDFYRFFREFHRQWTSQSDFVVEAKSQMMVDGKEFDPKKPELVGFFEEPREYLLQRQFGNGHAKEVAHTGISMDISKSIPNELTIFKEKNDEFDFHLKRPGAARMGPDIYAALYGEEYVLKGIQPVAPHARLIVLPRLASTAVSTALMTAGVQEVMATGDFSVKDWSQDPQVHGILVSTDRVAQVAAFYDRRQGSFLWARSTTGQGVGQVIALGNSSQPVGLSLARSSDLWVAKATFQDGSSRSATLTYSFVGDFKIGVLSSEDGRAAATTPSVLLGTLHTLPDPALKASAPWELKTAVRDISNEMNVSRPRFVLSNMDSRALDGATLEYYFTADSARDPVVEAERVPNAAWRMEHIKGDQYRIVVTTEAKVASNAFFPDAEGFAFRIHYSGWETRWNRGDWSRDLNIGFPAFTTHIVVRDNDGKWLSGEAPREADSLAVVRVFVNGRDEGVAGPNEVKPVLRVHNSGAVPLKDFHLLWYAQVPQGCDLDMNVWQTDGATITKRALGHGRWEIDAHFDRYILYPQQTTAEIKFGLHLPGYAVWGRNRNPSVAESKDTILNRVAIVDARGRKLWGDIPVFEQTLDTIIHVDVDTNTVPVVAGGDLTALEALAREQVPGDSIYARPMLRVRNSGQQTVKGFQLGLWLSAPAGVAPQLDAPWYVPGCQLSLAPLGSVYKLTYSCPEVILAPGTVWPDQTGSVTGLHLPSWQTWDRSTSWSLAPLTGIEAVSDRVTIETASGVIVKGARP